jgi:hypothetical protein
MHLSPLFVYPLAFYLAYKFRMLKLKIFCMSHNINIPARRLITYLAIGVSGFFFGIGCLLLWLLQFLIECLAFPVILAFALTAMTVLFVQRKINPSI